MAVASVRIEMDKAAIGKMLREDPGIRADLQGRVDKVVAAAGEGHEGSVWVGKDRQRGTVRTANHQAAASEANDHTLLKALDAARSP